jgi:hypothetical protein
VGFSPSNPNGTLAYAGFNPGEDPDLLFTFQLRHLDKLASAAVECQRATGYRLMQARTSSSSSSS